LTNDLSKIVSFDEPVYSYTASQDRVFLYLLKYNDRNSSEEVFFIGSAKFLKARLARHYAANWHYASFKRPSRISILGTIKEEEAPGAILSLTEDLTARGHRILPQRKMVSILSSTVKERETRKFLIAETSSSLKQYLATWKRNKDIYTGEPKNIPDPKPIESSSKTAVNSWTKRKLVRLIVKRKYPSVQSVKLSQKLAAAYNEKLDISIIDISLTSGMQKKAKEIEINLLEISSDWTRIDNGNSLGKYAFQPSPRLKKYVQQQQDQKTDFVSNSTETR